MRNSLQTWPRSTPRVGAALHAVAVALAGATIAAAVTCGRGDADRDALPVVSIGSAPLAAVARADAPITDILAVVTVPDRRPFVGRRVTVTGVKVQAVAGPNAFWVGPRSNQQIFVVRGSAARAGAGTVGQIGVGRTVSVSGVVRRLPADLDSVRPSWRLRAADEAMLARERVYLDADTVVVTGA